MVLQADVEVFNLDQATLFGHPPARLSPIVLRGFAAV
jgi:hypothetical protein